MSKEQQQFPLFRTDSATQWHKIISPQQVVSIRKGKVTAIGVAEIQDREYATLLNEHDECTEEDFTQALQDAYAQLYAQFPIKKQVVEELNAFLELDKVNAMRSKAAFGYRVDEWSLTEWSNAIAGEAGELCNITKKVHRGDYHSKYSAGMYQDAYAKSDYRPDIGEELADIIIYCHLLATREGLNLNAVVVKKFNHVSDQRGCNIKIPITGK